jgi:hypothetical protein
VKCENLLKKGLFAFSGFWVKWCARHSNRVKNGKTEDYTSEAKGIEDKIIFFFTN